MTYDELLSMFPDIKIREIDLSELDPELEILGLYADGNIFINNRIGTTTEKACVAIEEVGHHYTTTGNILDQNKAGNCKQEKRARAWGHEKMAPLDAFLEAYWAGVSNRYELAEFMEVTEEFLSETIEHYKAKHGIFCSVGEYLIYFDPLAVIEKLNNIK